MIVGLNLAERPVKCRENERRIFPYDIDDPVDQDVKVRVISVLHPKSHKRYRLLLNEDVMKYP